VVVTVYRQAASDMAVMPDFHSAQRIDEAVPIDDRAFADAQTLRETQLVIPQQFRTQYQARMVALDPGKMCRVRHRCQVRSKTISTRINIG